MSVRKSVFGQKDVYVSSERINLDAPVVANSGGVDKFGYAPSQPATAATVNLVALTTRVLFSSSGGYNAFILGKTPDTLSLVRASMDDTRPINVYFQVSFTASPEASGNMVRTLEFYVNGVVVMAETTENHEVKTSPSSVKRSARLLLKKDDVVGIFLDTTNAPGGTTISNVEITAFY